MNGFQNKKGKDLHKPIPGCMGRMINIFDMSVSASRTKLLTEKPHQDEVAPIHKNQPDVLTKKAADNFGILKEAKTITRNMLKDSSKTSGGIPMKMLIAQEMSREPQSIQKPSNVVAKLMGLETLPVQQSIQNAKISSQQGYSHNSLSREFQGFNTLQFDTKSSVRDNKYKDVHEIWQQSSRNTRFKDKPLQNKVHDENSIEKRMELVHQKFTEAKRLATDEKLLHSKEFQEAIEVLSSNRDLFLKFFEEPNSLLSKHASNHQIIPSASPTRRITVLKPSKVMEPKGVGHEIDTNQRNSVISNFVHHKSESISQPTRIVVLKPNLGMPPELKAGLASPFTSSRLLESRESYGCLGPDDALESREIAKEITRKMQEYVSNSQKDEILLSSSALSNGYVGDESSFNRSENGYIKEGCGYTSDLESLTPTSQHSCDYSFRLSPRTISSLSRASHSSEPSVVKEAKKRLSERLAMVTSNGISQEQSQMHRSSSTLGEMLAIHEVKKEESDNLTDSPRNLARSKSVPVSSSVYVNFGSRNEVLEPTISKSDLLKEVVAKPKRGMSSFKGKVSSLFLSRIKKAGREKPISSHCLGSDYSEASRNLSSESFHHCHSEETILVSSLEKDGKFSSSTSSNGPKKSASISKASFSFENQDHLSPSSVLEAPFEEDLNNSIPRSSSSAISSHPQALSRSPPIGSISRTLAPENPREILLARVLSKECEEQDRLLLVQKILSHANLLDNVESNSILARWHSLDSPLDPILLDEFLDRKEEEAKCRERQSNQRLLFDCVNEAILSIGHTTLVANYPWAPRDCHQTCYATLTKEVCRLVKNWFSCESENRNLTMDKLVKKEIAGNGWVESMCLEADDFSREIGNKMLEELVEEALADLTDGCL